MSPQIGAQGMVSDVVVGGAVGLCNLGELLAITYECFRTTLDGFKSMTQTPQVFFKQSRASNDWPELNIDKLGEIYFVEAVIPTPNWSEILRC